MAQFPLAGLLRLRGIELDAASGRLAGANRRVQESRERRARSVSSLSACDAHPADGPALLAIAAARSAARSQLAALDALITTADAEQQAAQAQYRAAKMRTVPLEKMAARHQLEQTAAELKAEQSALDESAIRRTSSR